MGKRKQAEGGERTSLEEGLGNGQAAMLEGWSEEDRYGGLPKATERTEVLT